MNRLITSTELKRLVNKRLYSREIAELYGCSEIYIKKLRQRLKRGETWTR